MTLSKCPVTWESGGWGRRWHGDGNAHAAAATVLPAAATTAAAGVTASTAATAHTHTHPEEDQCCGDRCVPAADWTKDVKLIHI